MAGHPVAMQGPWMGGPMGGPGMGPGMAGHKGGLGGYPGMGYPGMSGPGMKGGGGGGPGMNGMMGPAGVPMGPAAGGFSPDTVFFTGLPAGIDEQMLTFILAPYASVAQCRVDPGGPGQAGSAIVRFVSAPQAAWVVHNMNGAIPQNLTEPIFVRFVEAQEPMPPDPPGGGGKAGRKTAAGSHAAPGSGLNNPFAVPPCTSRPGGRERAQARQGGPAQRCRPAAEARPPSISMVVSGIEASGVLPGKARVSNESTLYVAGLTPDTRDLHLYQLFSPFGAISAKGVRAVANPDGTCRGFGFVDFLDPQSVQSAIAAYDGAILPDGTVMRVAVKTPKAANKSSSRQDA